MARLTPEQIEADRKALEAHWARAAREIQYKRERQEIRENRLIDRGLFF